LRINLNVQNAGFILLRGGIERGILFVYVTLKSIDLKESLAQQISFVLLPLGIHPSQYTQQARTRSQAAAFEKIVPEP